MQHNVTMAPVAASRPSETDAGRRWLSNFPAADRASAELLIDSLEIHDHVKVINGLRAALTRRLETFADQFPAVLIPIRSKVDLPVLPDGEHTAYDTYDPGAGLPVLPGSEADIGSLIRDLTTEYPNDFLPPDLGIEDLRSRKVRSLILVTDYCGSGKQAIRFADTFIRNRTLASWISTRLLSVNVLAYASSLRGIGRLSDKKGISFQTVIAANSIELANWNSIQRNHIVELCSKYAEEGCSDEALGYEASFGLHLTNLRVPNNLPQILIRGEGSWLGLFPGRSIPVDFSEQLLSYEAPLSLEQMLQNNSAARIAERITERDRPVPGLRALAALQLLNLGIPPLKVFNMLKLSPIEQTVLQTSLIAMGLITLEYSVTESGMRELKRNRWKGFKPPRTRQRRQTYVEYIPTQLR